MFLILLILHITVVAALNGVCDATDSAADQCDIADSECRVDGTSKCLCKTTHYVDVTACTTSKTRHTNFCRN